ncbi:MAG TPA: ABC transporter substrate-binding protein [Thermoleophilia bacterium]|nr:ABC transporter substrate-binding protein [Thermoleophilia bacterium]
MSVPFTRGPRRSQRRRAVWLVAALFVLAALGLLLAACGSSNNNSSSGTTPSASATPAAAATWTPADLAAVSTDSALKAMLPSSIVSSNNLRVASDIPYPPWEYYVSATSKQATGFDYDLSQAIGKKIGIPTSFNETPFDSIILAIKGGRRDMIMSDMYDNADRQKQGVSFVDYGYDTTSMLVPKGNPKNITNLNSLSGQTVCCESGTTQQAWLQVLNNQFKAAGKKTMTVLALPNQPAAFLALTSGRAVADLTDHSTALYNAKTINNGNTLQVVVDPASPQGYQPTLVGIGIVASNTALISTVQKALQDLIDDGNYQKIVNSYGLTPVKSAEINQGAKPIPTTSISP